jgi:acid phosphatase
MGKAFDRIVIVMLENSTRANVLANPYMRALREKGVFLANSFGVTHTSQPNYILSIGGDTLGIVDDTPGYVRWSRPEAPGEGRQ